MTKFQPVVINTRSEHGVLENMVTDTSGDACFLVMSCNPWIDRILFSYRDIYIYNKIVNIIP